MPKRPPKGDLPATKAEYDASPKKAVGIVVKHKPPMHPRSKKDGIWLDATMEAEAKQLRRDAAKKSRGSAAAATGDGAKAKLTKTKGERSDPRWPNPNGSRRAKSPRGAKLTIAENVRMGEPKVTSNNIFPKVTQKWKDKK